MYCLNPIIHVANWDGSPSCTHFQSACRRHCRWIMTNFKRPFHAKSFFCSSDYFSTSPPPHSNDPIFSDHFFRVPGWGNRFWLTQLVPVCLVNSVDCIASVRQNHDIFFLVIQKAKREKECFQLDNHAFFNFITGLFISAKRKPQSCVSRVWASDW